MEQFFENPQRFFDEITERLKRITRWSMFGDRRMMTETDVDHSLQTTYLAMCMLWIERDTGDPAVAAAIDGERLIALAALHDAGEGVGGDIRGPMKQHPILGPLIRRQERVYFFHEVIGALPAPLAQRIRDIYTLQERKDDPIGAFFWAVEVVGYTIRAMDEYRTGSKTLALDVFFNCWEEMGRLAERYASVRKFRDACRIEVEYALTTEEGKRAREAHDATRVALNGAGLEQAVDILEALTPERCEAMQHALVALAKRRNGDGHTGASTRSGTLVAPDAQQPALPFHGAASSASEAKDGQ